VLSERDEIICGYLEWTDGISAPLPASGNDMLIGIKCASTGRKWIFSMVQDYGVETGVCEAKRNTRFNSAEIPSGAKFITAVSDCGSARPVLILAN
jgi:hypothetical protein